jgi:hypothetical protein
VTGGMHQPRPAGRLWWGRGRPQVKPGAHPPAKRPAPRSWRRHLEGWQLGVLTVGLAGFAALLVLPREVVPDVLPVPQVDRREQQRTRAEELSRARFAARQPLPFDVRAVGEYYRRYGRAVADHRHEAASVLLRELRRSAQVAHQRHGDEPLLRLRALQTYFFVKALARWELSGQRTAELDELSGALLLEAERAGWVRPPRRLQLTAAERTALFRIRWMDLTGLRKAARLSPSLNDWRTYYRFLLEHPSSGSAAAADAAPCGGERSQALRQLGVVQALHRLDPSYPASLARGVLQYRMGAYLDAAESIRMHLSLHPRGPWQLRAQNYLAASLARVRETQQLE